MLCNIKNVLMTKTIKKKTHMKILDNNFFYIPNGSKPFKIYFTDIIMLRKVYCYFPSP